MTFRDRAAGPLAGLLLLALQGAHANLVQNGSFESGLSNWTASGAVEARTDEQPTDGVAMAVFNWGDVAPSGVLSQTVATAAGTRYLVSFDYWGWAAPHTQRLNVSVTGGGSAVLFAAALSAVGANPANPTTYTFEFTAVDTTSTLRFDDVTAFADGISSDLALDRVALDAVAGVPEPGTGVLFTAGLAMIGYATVRRSRAKPGADKLRT